MVNPRRTAGLAVLIGVVISGAAVADRVQNPIPVKGHTVIYNLSGGGAGILTLPGSGAGIPLRVYTNITMARKVDKVEPGAGVTTAQSITSHQVTVNDQEVSMGTPPTVSITTDTAGKVLRLTVNGKETAPSGGLADVQSSLQQFQLPNKDYKTGGTWMETVQLSSFGGADSSNGLKAVLLDTYDGIKPADGRNLMELTRHLQDPVVIAPRSTYTMGGFNLSSMTIQSVEQTALYDPRSGDLVSSTTHVEVRLKLKMGSGPLALPLAATIPLDIKTVQVKPALVARATSPSTHASLPARH